MSNLPSSRAPGDPTAPRFSRTTAPHRLELIVEREAGRTETRQVRVDGELARLGSHPSNDLVLDDPEVSRFHCRLSRGTRAWRVSDTGSLNGTAVHGVRVIEADLPVPECVLELGGSLVRVRELPPAGEVELLDRPSLGELYGTSIGMRRMFALLDQLAQSQVNVLIEGESGTGKELVASEIVRRGPRAQKPFVIVDCGAISPNLIDSELFGHVKGSFTGADRDRVGAFEAAHGGTVFLDEIGELPLELQPKLLRAIESQEIRRVGETRSRRIDVRVVAATNRRLEKEVNSGRFREDLYFRLSVVTLRVPPLRERLDDLELLVRVFLDALGTQDSAHLFTPAVLEDMRRYDWPGNVRELRNFVERTVVLRTAQPTGAGDTRPPPDPQAPKIDIELTFREAKERLLSDFERGYVTALLAWADGNVSKAARKGSMDRMNLYRIMQRHGLRESTKDG